MKKLIEWRNELKLSNKLVDQISIIITKIIFEYIFLKVIFKEGKNKQIIRKANLLGFKVLVFLVVTFRKISFENLGELKLFINLSSVN